MRLANLFPRRQAGDRPVPIRLAEQINHQDERDEPKATHHSVERRQVNILDFFEDVGRILLECLVRLELLQCALKLGLFRRELGGAVAVGALAEIGAVPAPQLSRQAGCMSNEI